MNLALFAACIGDMVTRADFRVFDLGTDLCRIVACRLV